MRRPDAAAGRRLDANQTETAAVARAREVRAEGRSLREIAAGLDAEGHRPREKRWRVQPLVGAVRV